MKKTLTIRMILKSLFSFAQFPSGMNLEEVVPNFKGKNQKGETIELYKKLEKGKVLLVFYRSNWCPYCKKYLYEIHKDLDKIIAKGTSVLVVTPEKSEGIGKTIKKTDATFYIITDEDYSIMKSYKIDLN